MINPIATIDTNGSIGGGKKNCLNCAWQTACPEDAKLNCCLHPEYKGCIDNPDDPPCKGKEHFKRIA